MSKGESEGRSPRHGSIPGEAEECCGGIGAGGWSANGCFLLNDIRRRIDGATLWLRGHLAEELDLTALARHVGCAPHYSSRLSHFKKAFFAEKGVRPSDYRDGWRPAETADCDG